MVDRPVRQIMEAESPADNRLLALYHRYLGDPDRTRDVYAGFALFFGGIALGMIGLTVFLGSNIVSPPETFLWRLREIAIALSTLGLPALLLGIVVLLPRSDRMVYIAIGGVTLCITALAVFLTAYPHHWNVVGTTDYSVHGITIYAAGLTLLIASTGAVLVAYHLERARHTEQPTASTTDEEAATALDADSVSEAEVQRDVEEAMSTTDISWGGIEKTETKRLHVQSEQPDFDSTSFDTVPPASTRGEGVDEAVDELLTLQGNNPKTATGRGTEDQIAALTELRDRHDIDPDDQSTSIRDKVAKLRDRFR